MLRFSLALALSVFLLADASAQTAPAAATTKTAKTAKASARTAARKAKKARRMASKSAPATSVNDGWPALDNAQTAVASSTMAPDPAATYGASAASSRGEIDNANVYAAPGMPVHIRTSNGIVPYSVRPARKPATATRTTLGN